MQQDALAADHREKWKKNEWIKTTGPGASLGVRGGCNTHQTTCPMGWCALGDCDTPKMQLRNTRKTVMLYTIGCGISHGIQWKKICFEISPYFTAKKTEKQKTCIELYFIFKAYGKKTSGGEVMTHNYAQPTAWGWFSGLPHQVTWTLVISLHRAQRQAESRHTMVPPDKWQDKRGNFPHTPQHTPLRPGSTHGGKECTCTMNGIMNHGSERDKTSRPLPGSALSTRSDMIPVEI